MKRTVSIFKTNQISSSNKIIHVLVIYRGIAGTNMKPKNRACMSIIIFNKINKQLLIPTLINQMTLINAPENNIESCKGKKIKNVVEIIPEIDSLQAIICLASSIVFPFFPSWLLFLLTSPF